MSAGRSKLNTDLVTKMTFIDFFFSDRLYSIFGLNGYFWIQQKRL